MIKLTPEEQAYWDKKYDKFVKEKVREALEEDEWLTEEEFWEDIDKYEKEYERERREKLLNTQKLKLQNNIGKISKRFIRA